MDNRFGVKDFFLFLLVFVLIGIVILAMFQYDRQWQLIQQVNDQVNNLAGDMARIQRRLNQGNVSLSSTSQSTIPANWVGFERDLRAHAQPDYAQGDDLIQVMPTAPNCLTPLLITDAYAQIVQGYIQDSLVTIDPSTLKFIPRLAYLPTISPNGLVYDFKLKHGITFSDGSPFTADDVVYTFNWMLNPDVQDPTEKSFFDRFSRVEKVNDYEVRFYFKEPYCFSLDAIGLTPIMSKAFYSHYTATQFNQSTGLMIGTGPYRLPDPTSWTPQPGQPITLVRNERYWGPPPSFNKLIWRVIENPAARATAFSNSDIDVFGPGIIGPVPEQYQKMLADKALVARTQHFALGNISMGFYYIGWEEKKGRNGPPTFFADPRVRKAMTMLIDRNRIIKDIMRGYATISTGPFSVLSPQSDPNVKPWPYDPATAQKLLAEAGFTQRNGALYAPDGKLFEFKLMYGTHSETAKRMAPIIKDDLAQAGILVDLDPQEFSVMLQRLDNRDLDAVLMGWGGVVHDDPYQIFDSSQAAGTGSNYVQYSDKALDAAISKARSTLDPDENNLMWHKVHDIIHADQPYTFLYEEKELTFAARRLHGLESTGISGLNTPDEWYVPLALQKYHD